MINKFLNNNIFKGDKAIWIVFFLLCIISIVEVYSASSQLTYHRSYLAPMGKHVFLLFWGVVFMVITLNIKCKFFKVLPVPMLIVSGLLLGIVLIIGQSTNGAQRWLEFGGVQIQPSEIAKGTLVLVTAQILSALQTENGADKRAFWYVMIISVPFLLGIFTENFSTAFLLGLVIFLMMFIGRVPIKQLGGLASFIILLGVLAIGAVMMFGNDNAQEANMKTYAAKEIKAEQPAPKKSKGVLHRMDTWKARIDKFLANKDVPPSEVDLDKDAQVNHAYIAIATSNIIGKFPGNSEEREWLPQAYSDFIYAIIIEEMGIGGAIIVALLYIILLIRAGRIANRCKNPFPAFLAMGLAMLLVIQALFNMCVAVGLAPVTGQPLPLISKGGTSTIINCVYIGAILSVGRSAEKKDDDKPKPVPAPVAETV